MKQNRTPLFTAVAILLCLLPACSPAVQTVEIPTATSSNPEYTAPQGAILARDAALAYAEQTLGVSGLTALQDWREKDITQAGIVGNTIVEFTSGDWIVTVSFSVVAPQNVTYTTEIKNPVSGYTWAGTVDPQGQIVEAQPTEHPARPTLPAAGEFQAAGWYGHVESLPTGSPWDDKLVLGNSAGEVGIEGATADLQAEIEGLRDRAEPGKYAHFWGTLTCGVSDAGGCRLLVERIRVGASMTEGDLVESWHGTLVSTSPGSQFDDYFVLSGPFPVAFGLHSLLPELQSQLESLRDTGQEFAVTGVLRTGVPDAFGAQIQVNQIELLPADK